MSLFEEAGAMREDLADLRRRLHRIPEIGLDLPRTQETVLAELDGLPLEITTGTALTSITAVLRGGKSDGKSGGESGGGATNGTAVLLRGDMDALPVDERTGEPFASEHPGAMHACGHDLHTAGLVGAARLLAAHREELPGDVVFMFQPGEEGLDGARYMIEEGVLTASGRPVSAAYGLHVFSSILPTGLFAGKPGPLMASSAGLFVRVIGAGGHGSAPHNAADPVPAACEMVTALQTLVTRRFDVFDPVVITVGSFHAGTKRNVIPDEATFDATVRTFSPAAQERVMTEAVRLCERIGEAHGLRVEATFVGEYPVTVNNPVEHEFVADTVRELFGAGQFTPMPNPVTASEDFSRVLDAVPGAYVFLGACKPGVDPGKADFNHSPLAAFDDSVIPRGAALLAELATRKLTALTN